MSHHQESGSPAEQERLRQALEAAEAEGRPVSRVRLLREIHRARPEPEPEPAPEPAPPKALGYPISCLIFLATTTLVTLLMMQVLGRLPNARGLALFAAVWVLGMSLVFAKHLRWRRR